MSTYSKEDLTTTLAAYRNTDYTLIRKCTYVFNILITILSK